MSRADLADYLIETADQCAYIAKTGRMLAERFDAAVGSEMTAQFSQLSEGGKDLSELADRIAQSLLAKAVEIDHERERKDQHLC